jgi:CheY-like chemotaxis protein
MNRAPTNTGPSAWDLGAFRQAIAVGSNALGARSMKEATSSRQESGYRRISFAGPDAARMAYTTTTQKPVVLVVEDEPLVRASAVDWAEAAGFEAVEAANADEAIRILESRTDVRVVFTDIDMPGSMDGLKLAHAVRNRWPPIKLVLTSGQMVPAAGDLPAGGHFVAKPYAPSEVADTLWKLVA